MKTFIFIILSCLFSLAVNAQTTEIQYLSGSGYQDTKTWDFLLFRRHEQWQME